MALCGGLSGGASWGPGVLDLRLVLAVTVLAAGVAVLLLVRRVFLSQFYGAFECLLRELPVELGEPESTGPWRSGLARYDGDRLRWYSSLAIGLGPSLVIERQLLEFIARRDGGGESAGRSTSGTVVLTLSYGARLLELAVAARYAAALTLWVESGPPGRGLDVA